MSTIIKIKNSGVAGSPATLGTGELAVSYLAGTENNGGDRVYVGTGAEAGGIAANIDVIGGKYFTDKLDHTLGILTANSAALVDGDKKINEWFVDNIKLDGNTITTTNPNGDLILEADGTGTVVINSPISSTGDQAVTGDFDVDGNFSVTGQSDLASLAVGDLTAGRLIFSQGVEGELVDSANLTFVAGTLTLAGRADIDAIRIDGSTISAIGDNVVNIQPGPTSILDIVSSKAMKLPVGTLADRPVGSTGYIRYNTTYGAFEGFSGGEWGTVGGVIDTDRDTYIRPETSAGADNDALEFFTDGVKRATFSTSGLNFDDESYFVNIGNINIAGNTISTDSGTLTLDPGPVGNAGTVIIEGDLQINGTTTTVNSTEITVDDPILTLGGDTAPTVDDNRDRGIQFRWHDGSSAKLGFFGFDDSTGRMTYRPDGTNTGEIFSGDLGDFEIGNVLVDSITMSGGSFSSNGVMYADTSGDMQFAASSTEGHVLQINASGVPFFGIIDAGTY